MRDKIKLVSSAGTPLLHHD